MRSSAAWTSAAQRRWSPGPTGCRARRRHRRYAARCRAAHANGSYALGVATGRIGRRATRRRADEALDDLSDIERVGTHRSAGKRRRRGRSSPLRWRRGRRRDSACGVVADRVEIYRVHRRTRCFEQRRRCDRLQGRAEVDRSRPVVDAGEGIHADIRLRTGRRSPCSRRLAGRLAMSGRGTAARSGYREGRRPSRSRPEPGTTDDAADCRTMAVLGVVGGRGTGAGAVPRVAGPGSKSVGPIA